MTLLPSRVYADLIGKPYVHGGRGPAGYDCAGIVVEVLKRLGMPMQVPETPSAEGAQHVAMQEILRARWIDIPRAVPGCVVFFRPGHVGVMLGPFTFLHTTSDVGQACIERVDGPLWVRRFAGFYEYAGALPA